MRRKLSTVEVVLKSDEGIHLYPGIELDSAENIFVGDDVVLLRPDRSELRRKIDAITPIYLAGQIPKGMPIGIRNLLEADVPIGTEVFVEVKQRINQTESKLSSN
ncbi:hypothetical protein ETAA8_35010 [Anatilimnocola aggregata]|uniref:Uncharacterized protein n=1 Tax=Anatilimnocola aggregata TaxID=2528021 RepID=A0A517YDU3_9BACT|nr:hypothetical protein [Anatilimnocola aggregata]QDU28401.1 hypothetical protein ETAA8_35010 [Anatilimnocola aggregata]